jgi:hypothetical protein
MSWTTMQGDDLDQPHGAYTHAYEHLLVGWFVCAVSAREEGGDTPAPTPHYCEHLLAGWNGC